MSIIVQRSRVFESSPSGAAMIVPTVVAPAYVGPGDVVAGAVAWWGLRAYSAASIGGNVVKIRRSSDNTTKIFTSQANGGINTADAFFDGSNYFVDTLYDQTGNGRDLAQATTADQPSFITSAFNGLPKISSPGSPVFMQVGATYAIAQPWTAYAVAQFSGSLSGNGAILGGTAADVALYFNGTLSKAYFFPSNINSTNVDVSPNVLYSVMGTSIGGGGTSTLLVDGLSNTVTTATYGNTEAFKILSDSGDFLIGDWLESGWWASDLTASQAALQANQLNYWGGTIDSATQSWLNAVNTNGGPVSINQRGYVDTLIKGLKADGIWTKLDRLWLFASENQAQALTDIVADALATAVNSPTFTADQGFTGNNSNAYINSGFDPSAGVNYQQNSACLFAWNNTLGSSKNLLGNTGGPYRHYINPGSGGVEINNSAGYGYVATEAKGLWLLNRTGASAYTTDVNGSQTDSSTSASGTPGSTTIVALANVGSGEFSNRQCCCLGAGGQLTSGDRTNIYTRLRTYMTAVGVP